MNDQPSTKDIKLHKFTWNDLENVTTCINIAYSETMAVFKNVHIRRTSKSQLEHIFATEKVELWGYKTLANEVVAAVMIREIDEKTGAIELLSVLPEYMGLGLSSSLLRNCEYVLHEAGKEEVQLQVYLPRGYSKDDMKRLGYKIVREEPWRELEDKLKPSSIDSWVMLTVSKEI
ncbi:uncharacterized protein [Blastocystis hominis]|uniref:N-acetyltransferase domain-containing protein n=1 Tax=Blastocystis hominis TaxID=12968 RepID=D8M758_BLAHO|nr:uncharacterized protein [Blastocystis hominis]CBK23897.2 unnamed protein product [Blastocystis hominis]|eukprot:XP_012897945.1 uncharacterized protein [Blastocystis hominis]